MVRNRSAIGVHIGSGELCAAQLGRRGELLAWAVVDGDDASFGDEQAERLRRVLDRRGFRGRRVVITTPDNAALSAILTVPDRTTGAPVEQIAGAELARLHRVDPETMACAVLDLPAPARLGQGTSVMAFGCSHEDAEALIGPFSRVGLDVIAIDSTACALARGCRQSVEPHDLAAILQIGHQHARIVVTKRGDIVYERIFDGVGISDARRSLESELGVYHELATHLLFRCSLDGPEGGVMGRDLLRAAGESISGWADNLAHQGTVAISYVAERYDTSRIGLVVLSGAGAKIQGLDGLLGDGLGCRTCVWDPDDTLVADCVIDPSLAIPIGLARRFDR